MCPCVAWPMILALTLLPLTITNIPPSSSLYICLKSIWYIFPPVHSTKEIFKFKMPYCNISLFVVASVIPSYKLFERYQVFYCLSVLFFVESNLSRRHLSVVLACLPVVLIFRTANMLRQCQNGASENVLNVHPHRVRVRVIKPCSLRI